MAAIIDEHQSYQDEGGKPLVNGKVFIGAVNMNPVTNPKAIFSDPDLLIPLANPQILNDRGKSVNKIYTTGLFSKRVENSSGTQIEEELFNGTTPTSGGSIPLDNVQGINALTADADPALTEYVDKQQYTLTILNDNTGDMTLNVDGVGIKDLVNSAGSEISPGQLVSGVIISFNFNEATDRFELVSSQTTIPAGLPSAWPGATAPEGYVLGDGASYNSVSDTSFADLFAVLGITYGGTGASNFNVPDYRGAVIIGLDNMGGTSAGRITNANADVLGGRGGLEKVGLVAENNGPHDHTYTQSGPSSQANAGGNETRPITPTSTSTGSQGSGTPHENTQPWIAQNVIIKK